MESNNDTKLAVLQNTVDYIKEEVIEIKTVVTTKYVTRDEFQPIKNLVYGMVTLILSGVILGLLSLVIRK